MERRRSFSCMLTVSATLLLLSLEPSSGNTATRGHGFDGGGVTMNSTTPVPTSPTSDVFNNHTYELRCSPRLRLLVDGSAVEVTGSFRGVLRVLCLLTRSAAQEGHHGVTPPARAGRGPGFKFGFLVTEDNFNVNDFRPDNGSGTAKSFDLVFSDGLPSDPNDFSSFSYSCQYRHPGHYFAVGERRLKSRSIAWVLLARLACRDWWEGQAPADSEEDSEDDASEDSEESALNAFNRRLRSALKETRQQHPRGHRRPHGGGGTLPLRHRPRHRRPPPPSHPSRRHPRSVRDNMEPTHTTPRRGIGTIYSYDIRCHLGHELLSANGIPLMLTKHMQAALDFACSAVPARLRMSGAPISLGPMFTKNNFNPDDYAVNSSVGYRVDVEYADGRKRYGRFLYPLHVRCGESPKVSVRGRPLVKHTLSWALLAALRCGPITDTDVINDDGDDSEESNEIDDAMRWKLLQNLRPPSRHPPVPSYAHRFTSPKYPSPLKQGRESQTMGSSSNNYDNSAHLSLSTDNDLSFHGGNQVTDHSALESIRSSTAMLPPFEDKPAFVKETPRKDLLSENSVRYHEHPSEQIFPSRMDYEVPGPTLIADLFTHEVAETTTLPTTPSTDEPEMVASSPTTVDVLPTFEMTSPSPFTLWKNSLGFPVDIPVTLPSNTEQEEQPPLTPVQTDSSRTYTLEREVFAESFGGSETLPVAERRRDGTQEGTELEANGPWPDVFHQEMETENEDALTSNRLGTRGAMHHVEDNGELLPKPERLDSEMDINGVLLEDDCLDNEDDPHNHTYSLRCAESASLSVDGSEVRVTSHMAAALFFLCALLSSAQGARTAEFDFGSIRTVESFRTEDVALYSGGEDSLDVLYEGNTQPRSHDVNIFWQTCRADPPGPEFSLDSGPLLPHSIVWSLFSKVRCGGDRDDASAGAERYFNDDVIPEERSSEEMVASYSNWHNYVIRCVPGNESLMADSLDLQMTAHMQTALSLLCFSSGLHALNATRNLGRIRSVEFFNPEEFSAATDGAKRIDVLYKDNVSRSDDRVSSMMPECQARPPRFFVNEQEIRAGGILWRLYRSLLCGGASELSDSTGADTEIERLMYEEHPTPLYVASNVHSYAVRCGRGGERLVVDGARVRATRHLQAVMRFLCDVLEVSVPQPVPELYSFGNIATREAFATAEFATETAAGRSFDVQYVQPTLRADRQPTSLRSMCEPEAQFTLDGHRLAPHTLVWALFRHLRCGELKPSQSSKSS